MIGVFARNNVTKQSSFINFFNNMDCFASRTLHSRLKTFCNDRLNIAVLI